ncbi:MAG: NnrU family protein [Pannonibacter sp.]
MSGMLGAAEFALAFAAFLLAHRVPTFPLVRSALVARFGAVGFTLLYSLLSLLLLAWVIGAAGRAPYIHLWDTSALLAQVAFCLMLLAFLIVCLALGRPNPFSFGGLDNHSFDAARPGIVRLTRHPLLTALALWSFAHLLVNGDLAHAVLFGSFLAFSLLGMGMINRRNRRRMGPAWHDLDAAVQRAPLSASLQPIAATVLRVLAALALLGMLLLLHPVLFGVDPLAGHYLP